MAFRVRPDGAIECDTAAEALSLSRQMVGASPAPTAAAKDRPDLELREPPSPPDPTAPGSSAWDPPSGTWYFYCQCGAIDMMNQSLDSGTESAVCRYCGVRATRPAIEEVPPAPDETAAIGSPAWWAWFFMQNGRDPTAADMAQATRARSTRSPGTAICASDQPNAHDCIWWCQACRRGWVAPVAPGPVKCPACCAATVEVYCDGVGDVD